MDSLRLSSPLTHRDVLSVLPGMFWDHDCVMLPGLGGFVCNPRSAWYDEAKRQIVPPSRDVLFNARLTTNDGLVANELMAKRGVMYPEALKAVESLVGHLQQQLEAGTTVELPGLGKLYREEDQQVRFMADAEFERMLQSFGHASIPLVARGVSVPKSVTATPKVVNAPSPEPAVARPSEEARVIPFRVQLARAAAAVAIPLTLAGAYLLADPAGNETLLGSHPLWNAVPVTATYAPVERDADVAAMAEAVQTKQGESIEAFVTRTAWEGLIEFDVHEGRPATGGLRVMVPAKHDSEAPQPVVEAVVVEEAEAPVVSDASEPIPAPIPAPKPAPSPAAKSAPVNFMIVGGAFGVQANAEKLASSMRDEGFDTSLHYQNHNGLTVVSMGGYATEASAREALADARARGHEKAWLKRL
ncbi:MAG: SPOR domain-containing protein [Bacteroidota bacterium]|nr:SPOR domain-containing protein [Bacteroidota bacterium]